MLSQERLRAEYRHSDLVRPASICAAEAATLYADYVTFVSRFAVSGRLLDVGCGVGWSASLFSERGFDVVGIDLNDRAFECRPEDRLHFGVADALKLPFHSGIFDVVCAYEFLEHSPEPQETLVECLRVLRPGGLLCIVGPNLLGLNTVILGLLKHVWRVRPIRRIFIRDLGMPRHPHGNTLFEVLAHIPLLLARVLRKTVSREATFTMREPDVTPPFHADNDSCYWCNPIDLRKFLAACGCRIIQNGRPGRLPGTSMLASGTWVAASKPHSQ